MKLNYVIICHSGAGNHSVSKENIHKNVCKKACRAAETILKNNSIDVPDLIKAAVEAVKVLEDHPCTNAGFGSNLSFNGKLQCEAAIMCGQSLRYGAVGCLSNIKNPILVAEKLLNLQLQQSLLSGGRYPPSVLVGQDATEWAIDNGMKYVPDSDLITVDRKTKYDKYKSYFKPLSPLKRKLSSSPTSVISPKKAKVTDSSSLDTVGVIIADSIGRIVSATSSGGIFLKHDGRLGQSCMFGCGCYSEQRESGISVAAVSTGLGEQLMRTVLPMRVCDALAILDEDNGSSDIHEWFRSFIDKNFMNSPFVIGDNPKSFGICSLKREQIASDRVSIDLLFGHSTPSMCLAYLSSSDNTAHAIMSRVDSNSEENFAVGSLGMVFEL